MRIPADWCRQLLQSCRHSSSFMAFEHPAVCTENVCLKATEPIIIIWWESLIYRLCSLGPDRRLLQVKEELKIFPFFSFFFKLMFVPNLLSKHWKGGVCAHHRKFTAHCTRCQKDLVLLGWDVLSNFWIIYPQKGKMADQCQKFHHVSPNSFILFYLQS